MVIIQHKIEKTYIVFSILCYFEYMACLVLNIYGACYEEINVIWRRLRNVSF